ncbi:hypothetical protein HBZC1_14280 [Helicobacter bizzozeronii CIII-1]|uniref:Transmembrane protein n=1 Tax=Helicobacter bizzozeronii (strain CIII-1) TaxID=1002804 RepID=F8KU75_HELBC|nr:hypothetical protein HBZC1_14280 [Helicobacter bizzozeronii CIII-1]
MLFKATCNAPMVWLVFLVVVARGWVLICVSVGVGLGGVLGLGGVGVILGADKGACLMGETLAMKVLF